MFLENLKDLRLYEGYSQKEVAKKITCHLNTYRKYESGESELPLSKALILAEVYNVSLDYLLGKSKIIGAYQITTIDVNRNVKYLRKKNGYTQKQIAERLFCQLLTYQSYENNKMDIPVSIIIKLADFYHISTDALVCKNELR